MLFPSRKTSSMCKQFLNTKLPGLDPDAVRILILQTSQNAGDNVGDNTLQSINVALYCVLYPAEHAAVAKQVWQHTGDGVSSRRAEFFLTALREGHLQEDESNSSPKLPSSRSKRGPRRYQKQESLSEHTHDLNGLNASHEAPPSDGREFFQFIEERFGRNLNEKLAQKAKVAVRRRIAGTLLSNHDLSESVPALEESPFQRTKGLSEDDVYLFPCGMSSIFNTHQILLASREQRKSVCFGFPYIDTLKVLEKWGPGVLFYGNGTDDDLDHLERRLKNGERFLALFTEFPSNPLLRSPDLQRIRRLADQYDFAIVVDESVGNLINVNVLQYADVVVSSLTKVFSGDSNVMGGSATLNTQSPIYQSIKQAFNTYYEDNYWIEDAVFLERNSRDFISRIERMNYTTEAVIEFLRSSPLIKDVYYPNCVPSKKHYDACKNPHGGYGGLFSLTFHAYEHAIAFFDNLHVLKGPSLGTNFTLSCPFVIIAHYNELDWAASFGVPRDLVRVAVGLEEKEDLIARFQVALDAIAKVASA
ncbi:putative cystathionine gamma-synthase [Phaeomoniella chlamydospora]|uniref:cystathionine gamma-synthase n=1 Tax=Phaeomoniella chlamydospora TaxID=158046 RepID=A0A0G2EFD1_PHACM|nr:putative cystathionine gamma-synthase [Phaeomoniella chlamydospora]